MQQFIRGLGLDLEGSLATARVNSCVCLKISPKMAVVSLVSIETNTHTEAPSDCEAAMLLVRPKPSLGKDTR